MALNIKDPQAEKLAAEVAQLAGESKTAAVRTALAERRQRLLAEQSLDRRDARARRRLENVVWPQRTEQQRRTVTRDEREAILGYGPDGV